MKESTAKKLRDKAEAVHILALELELDCARARQRKNLGETFVNPFSASLLRTRLERETAHRVFEEASEIVNQECEKTTALTGEPNFDAVGSEWEEQMVYWRGITDLRNQYEASRQVGSETDQSGTLSQILDDMRLAIEWEKERVNQKARDDKHKASDDADIPSDF